MKNLLKKIKHRKEGSSLASVIIGIVFLATLGITILTVATRYVVSVYVNQNSTDNFYQTEGILAEVKTGLLEYAGDASEAAYTETLESYGASTMDDVTSPGTVSSMKTKFAKNYLGGIIAKLTKTSSYVWDDSKVGEDQKQIVELDSLKALTNEPDAVQVAPGKGNVDFVITQDASGNYLLTIENLLIDYTDQADYRSSIQTNIVIKVPDYKFQGDSTLNELKKYISISDDTLQVSNAIGLKANFTGNIYSGNKDVGIRIDSQNGAAFQSETIISRGSFDVYTGADVTLSGESSVGELWLQNIRVKPESAGSGSTLSTKLSINENAYIQNDLDIEDNNAEVSLAGKYYGYSYNKENDNIAATSPTRSIYSSAILVNGLNTSLKTGSLDKLILAGRTFVSRNNEDGSSAVSDIMMGESLAVKSNQIAYLLPDEYIKSGHNPLGAGEDRTIYKDNLLNSDIGKYLDQDEPYTANYNNNGYVFYYLKFKDENSANKYFKQYYEGNSKDEDGNDISNKEQLDEKAQSYISTTDASGMKLSANLYLIAGNIIHNYYSSNGSSIQTENYFDNTGNPKSDLLLSGKKYGQDFVGKQLTLLASGSTGSMRLADDAAPLVSKRIIDFSKVTEIISKTDSTSGGQIYVTPGDYTVDGSISKGIIIAQGNVTVAHDFEGLILAGGTVVTQGNRELKANQVLTGNLLEFAKKDSELSKIFYGMNGSMQQETTDMNECISYQNWEKNNY